MERDSKIKQLDLEIESRISQFWVHMEPLTNHKDTSVHLKDGVSYDTVVVLWQAFKNPPSFNPKITTSIYKEFDTRTTISLMVELSTLLQDKYEVSTKPLHIVSENNEPIELKPMNKKDALHYNEIRQIDRAAIFIGGNGIFYQSEQPSIRQIWQSFASEIISDRWDYYFPYTDCLFC